MENKKVKGFKIYTKRLANILCKQGYTMLGTEINNEKPWLYVYLFEDSDALRASVQEFLKGESANER